MSSVNHYLDLAYKAAFAHEKFAQAKICAVLVSSKGQVLSFGFNHKKTHPLQARFAPNEHAVYLHAEIDAIRRAKILYGKDALVGGSIYVARSRVDGSRACACPCSGCMAAIKAHGITGITFTTGE